MGYSIIVATLIRMAININFKYCGIRYHKTINHYPFVNLVVFVYMKFLAWLFMGFIKNVLFCTLAELLHFASFSTRKQQKYFAGIYLSPIAGTRNPL